MNDIPTFNDRVVAFIDILGFREIVRSLEGDPELHRELHYALSRIGWILNEKKSKSREKDDIEVSVFSDSIAISCEQKTDSIVNLIMTSGQLQADLLMVGILIRGGVAAGQTIHEKEMIYGEGMIRAYRLESSAAFYPRIVVDESVVKLLPEKIKTRFLASDVDYLFFINPFEFPAYPGNAEELASDGFDPREEYFKMVEDGLTKGRERCSEIDQIAKWDWMGGRYRTAYDDYLQKKSHN
ncbi:MAG: hypothetical protein HGB33_04110 [Syntrophaceae bacterium]|nr:hypothetical protein [Syntrophaceae bacterium]